MPQAIPIAAQIAATALAGSLQMGAVASALIIGGATILGGYVASELISSGDLKAQDSDELAIRANYVSTERSIPLIYGERLVGSNDIFIEGGIKGADPVDDGKRYLWVVHILGEGECEGIKQTIIEDISYDTIYLDSKPIWEYSEDDVAYWFYSGSSTQTYNTTINAGTRIDQEEKFVEDMRFTSYLIFRFKIDGDAFTGIPNREVVIQGLKVKDVRDSVVKWSQNPSLILYDYLTNSRYGLGWSESLINIQSFQEAANYCDEYGWQINYVVASSLKSQSVIDTLLGHFRGALYWYDDLLFVRFIDVREETPLFHIEDKHIARDSMGKALVSVSQPSRFGIPDGAIINYVDKRNNWVTDRVNIGETDGQINRLDFPAYTDRDLALEMGTYVLERQRLNRVFSFTLRADTVALDPNDLVDISSRELGLDNSMARVKSTSITSSGLLQVTVIIEDRSLYDKVFDPDTSDIYEVNLPSIKEPPPSVEDVYVVEDVYDYREVSYIRLNVYFSPPSNYPWFKGVDVYVGYPDEFGDPPAEEDFLYRFPATSNFQIDPVQEGETYYIRLNSVSDYGVKQENENAYKVVHKVKGVSSEVPECPTGMAIVVNAESMDITANYPSNTNDILGYELRFSPNAADWTSSIFVSFASDPLFSFNNVRPAGYLGVGTHRFWLGAKHRNGNYCTSPVSYDLNIPYPPPGTTAVESPPWPIFYWSYSSIYNITVVEDYIYCSHTDGDLSGYLETTTYDLASITPLPDPVKYLIYVDTGEIDLFYGQRTWNDLAPYGDDWYDFAYDDGRWKRWSELWLEPYKTEATKVDISVKYSDSPSGPFTEVKRMELLTSIITGRYVRFRFEITDFNQDSRIRVYNSEYYAFYLNKPLLIAE